MNRDRVYMVCPTLIDEDCLDYPVVLSENDRNRLYQSPRSNSNGIYVRAEVQDTPTVYRKSRRRFKYVERNSTMMLKFLGLSGLLFNLILLLSAIYSATDLASHISHRASAMELYMDNYSNAAHSVRNLSVSCRPLSQPQSNSITFGSERARSDHTLARTGSNDNLHCDTTSITPQYTKEITIGNHSRDIHVIYVALGPGQLNRVSFGRTISTLGYMTVVLLGLLASTYIVTKTSTLVAWCTDFLSENDKRNQSRGRKLNTPNRNSNFLPTNNPLLRKHPVYMPVWCSLKGTASSPQLSQMDPKHSYFDPVLHAQLGDHGATKTTVLADSGFTDFGRSAAKKALIDHAVALDTMHPLRRKSVLTVDYNSPTNTVTVANGGELKSIGRSTILLKFPCVSGDFMQRQVEVDIYEKLSYDIILSNHEMARGVDSVAFDYKQKMLEFITGDSTVQLSVPRTSWRGKKREGNVKFSLTTKPKAEITNLKTTECLHIPAGEVLWAQVALPLDESCFEGIAQPGTITETKESSRQTPPGETQTERETKQQEPQPEGTADQQGNAADRTDHPVQTTAATSRTAKAAPHLVSEAKFYVAEFIKFCQSDTNRIEMLLHLKGHAPKQGSAAVNSTANPYESKHLPAWRTINPPNRKEDVVKYAPTNPDANVYKAGILKIRATALLPMYAFQLNKDTTIPKKIRDTISLLLQRRQ